MLPLKIQVMVWEKCNCEDCKILQMESVKSFLCTFVNLQCCHVKSMKDRHNYRIFSAEQLMVERDCSIFLLTAFVCCDTCILWLLSCVLLVS